MIDGRFVIKRTDVIELSLTKEELLDLREDIDEMFPREKEKEFIYVPTYPTQSWQPNMPWEPQTWYGNISSTSAPPPSEDD